MSSLQHQGAAAATQALMFGAAAAAGAGPNALLVPQGQTPPPPPSLIVHGSPPSSGNVSGGGCGQYLVIDGSLPSRFKALPPSVQQRILSLTTSSTVVAIKDFDDKVGALRGMIRSEGEEVRMGGTTVVENLRWRWMGERSAEVCHLSRP